MKWSEEEKQGFCQSREDAQEFAKRITASPMTFLPEGVVLVAKFGDTKVIFQTLEKVRVSLFAKRNPIFYEPGSAFPADKMTTTPYTTNVRFPFESEYATYMKLRVV